MEWYYIVLIVVGYFIMAIAAGVLCAKMEDYDDAVVFGIVWPIFLPVILICFISRKIYHKIEERYN